MNFDDIKSNKNKMVDIITVLFLFIYKEKITGIYKLIDRILLQSKEKGNDRWSKVNNRPNNV